MGKPHGKGKLTYANGSSHEGTYEEGEPHGLGKYVYASGDTYEGMFEKNKKVG